MKNLLLIMFFICFAGFIYSQSLIVVDNFDSSVVNNRYLSILENPSTISLSDNHSDYHEGTGSINFNAVLQNVHSWGTYAELQDAAPDGQFFDWSLSDSLSLWIKVYQPASQPANMVFRIQLRDQPTTTDQVEMYVYEHAATLDAASDWFNLRLSLKQIVSDGTVNPGDSGFVITPTNWNLTKNNEVLDYNKIISYGIIAVTTIANVDSVKIGYDNFVRFGFKSVPAIVFNGVVFPTNVASWTWGQSTLEVETGAGPVPGTNAIKWVQGDEWGSGWTGIGTTISPPFNLAGSWPQDSCKIKLKCQEGVGPMRIQFEGGSGKVGTVFTPIADNQWHQYAFALREMIYQDGTTGFDSSSVQVVGLMAEASGIAGKVIYVTDWWTGNPVFDVIPPAAPTNIAAITGSFTNVVTWSDVTGEDGEVYNVYYSKNPIIDLNDYWVNIVKLKIPENEQNITHVLRAPVSTQSTTYYYAVTCVDEAGNESVLAPYNTPTTNDAEGVVTISLNAPSSTFNADGDLTEWSGVTPIYMAPGDGGYVATQGGGIITNASDLSLNAYLAVDNTYLYAAFDVNDDIVVHTNATSYENDCPDLFIGLYNWHGKPHVSLRRGAQPDYQIRFAFDRAFLEGVAGGDSILIPGANYYWQEKFPTGYLVEARIPWATIAAESGDNLFTPYEGYRIPLDFSINDNDGNDSSNPPDGIPDRDGVLTYSPNNDNFSYQDVSRWLYTWIGALWSPLAVEDEYVVDAYSLSQNYPNPFNPATQIRYTLEKPGMVSIKVFDVLGRLVSTLEDQFQNEGSHTVNFNASGLSSGVYFYRIESGSFQSIKKMMLLK